MNKNTEEKALEKEKKKRVPQGPQGPALVASGKASPHASCTGASQDSSNVDAGA